MRKALFLFFSLVVLLSCTNGQFGKIEGNGHIVKENRTPGDFKGVHLAGSMDVIITKGNSINVTVEADDNLLQYIETKVKDGVLRIGTNTPRLKWISSRKITVYITVPELNRTGVSGSGSVKSEDVFSTNGEFSVSVSGSGSCQLNVKAKSLDAHISGSGGINLAGSADNSDISISGSGRYKGFNMETKDATLHISGSGGAETSVSTNLDAHISGSGGVRYKGEPTVKARTSGSGRVRKA